MKILVMEREGVLDRYAPQALKEQCAVVYARDPANVPDGALDADAIVADAMGTVSADLIQRMPKLRLIHSDGVGFQGINLEAARQRGIYVCNCQSMNAVAVAEQAVLLMLACLRDLVNGNEDVLQARQIEKKEAYMVAGDLRELGDCTVGFLGYGAIARETARLVQAFGAKALYFKPHRLPPEQEKGVEYRTLDGLLSESDIVSLHLPLNASTENTVDEAFLAKMKPGSFLINTARGGLVKSDALLSAIECGHLAGAGLDCVENEPVQPDNIFLTASPSVQKKIVFSPHIGGITASSFRRGYAMIWEDLELVSRGERPRRIVNGI